MAIAVIAPVVTGLEIHPARIANDPVIVDPQDIADPDPVAVMVPPTLMVPVTIKIPAIVIFSGLAGGNTGRVLLRQPRRAVSCLAGPEVVTIMGFAPSRVCRGRHSDHGGDGDGQYGQFLENTHGSAPSYSWLSRLTTTA